MPCYTQRRSHVHDATDEEERRERHVEQAGARERRPRTHQGPQGDEDPDGHLHGTKEEDESIAHECRLAHCAVRGDRRVPYGFVGRLSPVIRSATRSPA